MDLASLLVQNGAPLIGGLIKTAASAAGGPVAGILAGVVVDAVAKAVGSKSSDPAAVVAAIQADPAKAAQVIPQVEDDHADLIKAHTDAQEALLHDVQDAREKQGQLVTAGSPLAWGPVVISLLIVVGFFAACFLLLTGRAAEAGQAGLMVVGVLVGSFQNVVGFYLGSSAGSAEKSQQLAQLAGVPAVAKAAVTPKGKVR